MASFQEVIQLNKPVLVDFSAEWCGPCQMMSPILKEAKGKLGDRAMIIKVDIDRNKEAAQHFQIQGVPTLILFRKGQIKWRKSGVVPAQEIVRAVDQFGN